MTLKYSATTKVALPLILLFSSQAQNSFAADSVKVSDDGGLELSITANRRLQKGSPPLVAVTIIDKKIIENSQATEIMELLKQVPGLTLQNSGGMGKATSIHIRGTNSSHVLVLIDGVKVGSATLGSVAFQDIPLENIERIEVVRGPRSALYGSEAIGGVIQIFTRKGTLGFKPQITVSAGSNNLRKLSVSLAGGNGKTRYNLNAGSQKTDGFDARRLAWGFPDAETDDDGYRREQVSLGIGHFFTNGVDAQINIQQAKGNTEFDNSGNDHNKYKRQAISGKIKAPIGERSKIAFQLGQSKDESNSYSSGVLSRFNTKRNTATVHLDTQINSSNALVTGIDWLKDHIDTTTAYSKNSRRNTGVFASYTSHINNVDIELSARQDNNEQFGNKATGSLALGLNLNNGLRLSSSYGSAFKAPTFNDLYFPSSAFSVGNPAIKAESSKNVELGIQQTLENASWGINVFSNEVDNLISWAPRSSDGKWTPTNTDKAKIKGLEANYKTQLNNWDINTNLALLNAKNDNGVNRGKNLQYRPKKTFNLAISRQLGRWNIGSSLHAESSRFTNPTNTSSLAGFATLDLRAEYAMSKNWSVGMKVGNVLDKEYETNEGYNQAGLNGMLSLKYAPK